MNDTTTGEPVDLEYEEEPVPTAALPRSRQPLLPEAGAGGTPLVAVIAVISFLAAMALAAFFIITQTTGSWTSSLRSEMTVQIKGDSKADIELQATAAAGYLRDTNAFQSVEIVDSDEAASMLEPWLGTGNVQAFLTIPALIKLQLNPAVPTDLSAVFTEMKVLAPNAEIDDHSRWNDRLATAGRSMQMIAFIVFLLVLGAACAISIFAARAGLAANRDIVSILHLVGATDEFIAQEVQSRFFLLGMRGALLGLLIAISSLSLVAFILRARIGVENFLPAFSLSASLLFSLLVVPIIICAVTAFTARATVLRALNSEF